MPSDRLKAFEFKSAFLYKSSQAQIALINANKEISLNKWNVALNTITLINTKNLPYPIFGIGRNSNGDNGQRKLVVDRQLVVPFSNKLLQSTPGPILKSSRSKPQIRQSLSLKIGPGGRDAPEKAYQGN